MEPGLINFKFVPMVFVVIVPVLVPKAFLAKKKTSPFRSTKWPDRGG
jgi:hypothetical protein